MTRHAKAHIPTQYGDFDLYSYAENHDEKQPHLAMVNKEMNPHSVVPVRIHSECMTGDLFGSLRCDCGEQFHASMKYLSENHGVMIYLRQEGRGIGLINKLEAYNLQDTGLDTVDANVHLGFEPDERDFHIAITILKDLGVSKIDLLTNNPEKIHAIEESEIILHDRIPLIIKPGSINKEYLKVKETRMGHLLK